MLFLTEYFLFSATTQRLYRDVLLFYSIYTQGLLAVWGHLFSSHLFVACSNPVSTCLLSQVLTSNHYHHCYISYMSCNLMGLAMPLIVCHKMIGMYGCVLVCVKSIVVFYLWYDLGLFMTWPCVGHVVHLEDCDKLAGWGPDGIFEMFLLAVFIYYCFKVTFIDATMKWIYNMKCNIKLLFSLASSWLKSLRERQRARERGREREREAERVCVCVCVWWLWVRAEKRANENCLEVEIEGTTKNIVCHIIMKNDEEL